MEAVLFDLFGTLVDAPGHADRAQAARQLAQACGCETAVVERYFTDTWRIRHDGTLATLPDLAAHLAAAVARSRQPAMLAVRVSETLRDLAGRRLTPDASVIQMMRSLRGKGLRIGVLSDASADIAACWLRSPIAAVTDAAVFSCRAGAVKPDRRLYDRIRRELGVAARRVLYVGDGGGNELTGAVACGMTAAAVRRRGPADALAFGETPWPGPVLSCVEAVPAYLEVPR